MFLSHDNKNDYKDDNQHSGKEERDIAMKSVKTHVRRIFFLKNNDYNQHTGKEEGDITMKSVSGNSGKSPFIQKTS